MIGAVRDLGEVYSAVGGELLGSFHTEIFFRSRALGFEVHFFDVFLRCARNPLHLLDVLYKALVVGNI